MTIYTIGTSFWANLMDSRTNSTSDDVKLRMYGLMKQSKFGAQSGYDTGIIHINTLLTFLTLNIDPEVSPKTSAAATAQQLEAWKKCSDMSQKSAKVEFLNVLYSSAPYWKYQQYI